MEADFWHTRWENMQIGFHEGAVNRMLSAHIGALGLDPGTRIFLPLCGKTRDIAWLLAQGYRVAGAELSEIAVKQLFEEMAVTPEVTAHGPLKRYAAVGLDIFVGDIFDLTADLLGPVDAVYDRAAFVALPDTMRGRYAGHLAALTDLAPQLLVTFEYDQSVMAGPPFSLSGAAVRAQYGTRYTITQLADIDVPGGLKGVCPAREKALHLTAI
ncbi:thiopurine S-methyltransferase [Roseovarius sp. 217]|uniref:thiopurine S-methyltransferase n=1 Tax=Roseovarius sp. (strain 217) TaxID=314264 RepID=UPI00006853C7|nr:thiopurine S-methyltransferase [Roseovarius sp. 217]EAQ23387.1 thiopurine S-methyltransferase family protein [Roseovarius sp. 217]